MVDAPDDAAVPRITLKDGRNLAYAEYGDLAGTPVFFFHGTQSSRLERPPDESIPESLGVRFITIDRPGHGLSNFQPDRQLLDWPNDVVALADALGFDKFAVMGMSAGGPYALACAHAIPERLTTVTVIAGAAPLDQPEVWASLPSQLKTPFVLARKSPWLVSGMLSVQRRRALSDPVKATAPVIEKMSPSDQAIAARPEIAAILPGIFAEAYRLGHRGPAWELTVLARPWGFAVAEIMMPVTLWQGEDDRNVPVEWGHYLAETLPKCTAYFLPGEGHLLFFDHTDEILAAAVR